MGRIAMVIMGLAMCACTSWSGYRADDEVVARVGGTYLYNSELAASMPSNLSKEDSVSYAQAYTSKWIVEKLKQDEAEKIFSQSEQDIDLLVEEYRRSLLVRKLDQYYIESEPYGEVTAADIADYYNAHRGDFRISAPMVRGEIVAIGDDYRRRDQLLKLFKSTKASDQEDFAELCRKNNFLHLQFEEWVSFNDFLGNLPLLRTSGHEDKLDNRSLQTIHHNKTYYYYRITSALKRGDTMPLNMVRENIRQILINKQRNNILRKHEELLMKNALSSGHAKIIAEEKKIDI
ncbi:MAG: hypothetical protein IKA49_04425 [Alistipes sp.]|nr:hypothetical protein [Alistipes sp.]